MTLESLSFLWQKWTRLERYFGDAGAVRRAMSFRDEEYRNLQKDQEVEEDAIAETPVSLGLSASIGEVEESFRFQHLIPRSVRADQDIKAPTSSSSSLPVGTADAAGAGTAATGASATSSSSTVTKPPDLKDHSVAEALDEHQKLGSSAPTVLSVHIARPDVSKMLAFRPALDVVGRKRPATEVDPAVAAAVPGGLNAATSGLGGGAPIGEERNVLPTMIPKCLQDLLAVLPSRPLKGAKPDVDYLLTVLQTVVIPPVPVKELEHFRYDSLRLSKEEDEGGAMRRLFAKDDLEGAGGLLTSRPTRYRDQFRLNAKMC